MKESLLNPSYATELHSSLIPDSIAPYSRLLYVTFAQLVVIGPVVVRLDSMALPISSYIARKQI